jgi:lantibiotic biosynthesis protein
MTALQTDAAKTVAEVAARLADPETVVTRLTDPRNVRSMPDGMAPPEWHPLSLGDGYPGIALLFAELGHEDGEQHRTAHRYLSSAAQQLAPSDPGALYIGGPALAFAAAAAARRPGEYERLLTTLDEWVERLVRARLRAEQERLAAGRAGTGFSSYDVITGVTGMGRYLLSRPEASRPLLTEILEYLVALTRPVVADGVELPGWWVNHSPSVLNPELYAQGHINFGLAHGIAGPLALLALAWQDDVRVPGHEEAIGRIADWLVEWAGHDDAGPYWPGSLMPEQYARRPDPLPGTRTAWCYGVPGTARALQLAGQALGRSTWTAFALRATRAYLARPEASYGAADAGFCHGWAGLLHITWRLGRDAGDADVLAATHRIAEHVLASYDPEAPFGFRATSADSTETVDLAGLLEGAAGVALALHTFATGKEPASGWDEAFLVA